MKQLTCYQTADGNTHMTHAHALRHADERYGEELVKHARAISALDSKYSSLLHYLEQQTDEFAKLIALKADRDTLEQE